MSDRVQGPPMDALIRRMYTDLAGFNLKPGTIETIVEVFLDGVREGLRPPRRCFDIPGFGAFWRIGDNVSFVWNRDEWPTAGGEISDRLRGYQEEDE